ncbi:MAG: hypothetical protein ACLP0J_01380 [Solirubrobacteraceae bacterium]
MTSVPFELIAFELVEAAPVRALLRLDARWSGAPLRVRPVLIIDDGARRHRQEAMLAPPRRPGVIRAAYQTPSDLINRAVAFMLDLGGGTLVALPAPAPWRSRSAAATATASARAPVDHPVDDYRDAIRRDAEIDLLREALVERAAAAETQTRAAAAEAQARATAEEARMRAAAAELHARVAAAEAQLHSERERGEALQARAEALEAQAQELHGAIAGLAELLEQEGVHASVLAEVVGAETERRVQSESLAQTLQARVALLETRLGQLVEELAFAAAAREDAEHTATELLAQAARADWRWR